MFIWCRALAAFALSPTACTLHWCRIGNLEFWLSALLSSLVCGTRLVFGVHMVRGCGGCLFMRTALSTSSAEAPWHGLRPKLLEGFWQLRSVS